MKIRRPADRPAAPGPADWFTGSVRIDPLFAAEAPSRMAGNLVAFAPGARTHWHTHPLGQTLLVTEGTGWVQRDGGPVEAVRAGDVVRFEPGERHWHGATATEAMTHVAVQEAVDGIAVTWMEPVPDDALPA